MIFVNSITRAAFAAALCVCVSPLVLGGAGMPGERLIGAFAKEKAKTQNIRDQLAGLNSLNRHTNGLTNSSDPRMYGVREYMGAYAKLPDAEAALQTATTDLTNATQAFHNLVSSFGLTSYDGAFDYAMAGLDDLANYLSELNNQLVFDTTNSELLAERDALSAAFDAIYASPVLTVLTRAQIAYDTASGALKALQQATTDDALTAALTDAANENRVAWFDDGNVTSEILDWAKNALGIATVLAVSSTVE